MDGEPDTEKDDAVSKIADGHKQHGDLDLLVKEDLVEIAVEIADEHVDQSIDAQDGTEKEIDQKSAEKAHQHAEPPAPHEAEADGDKKKDIRCDFQQDDGRKYRALQQKCGKHHKHCYKCGQQFTPLPSF